jgi:hypothetical protein
MLYEKPGKGQMKNIGKQPAPSAGCGQFRDKRKSKHQGMSQQHALAGMPAIGACF